MKITYVIILLAILIQPPVLAWAGRSGNLAAYLKMAMANNDEIAAGRAKLKAAQSREPQSGVMPDPVLGVEYYLEPVETRTGAQRAAVSISQKIPWFDKLDLQRKRSGSDVIRAEITLQSIRLRVAEAIKNVYAQYVFNGTAQKIVQENRDLIDYLEEVATTQYSGGKASYGDVLKIQTEAAKLEQEFTSLTDRNTPLQVQLNNLMGSDPRTLRPQSAGLGSIDLTRTKEQITQVMFKNNPDLLDIEEQIEGTRTELKLAKRDYFPDFTFSLKTIITDSPEAANQPDGGRDPIIGGLSMNLPLHFTRRHASVAEKNSSLLALKREQQHQVRILTDKLEQTFFRYRDADRRYKLYEQILLPKARQAMEVTLEGFRAGQYSTIQAIAAQRDLLDFKLAESRALTDRVIAIAAIERLAGVTLINWNLIDVP